MDEEDGLLSISRRQPCQNTQRLCYETSYSAVWTAQVARPVERDVFLDPASFEQLEVLERELIDDYALGRLSQKDADACERHLLSSARGREALAFSNALHARGQQSEATVSSDLASAQRAEGSRLASQIARIAAAVLVLVAGGYAVNLVLQTSNDTPSIVEAHLQPGVLRSEGAASGIELPGGASEIRFLLSVPRQVPQDSRVRLELHGPGTEIEVGDLVVGDGELVVTLASSELGGSGQYQAELFLENDNDRETSLPEAQYRFSLARRE